MLVHWQGKLPEEATWEDTFSIRNQFPDFNLEDKVVYGEGRIVENDFGMHYNSDKPLQVYYRTKKGSNIGYKRENTCN